MNQLSFGAESGPGDACGRCFSLSGTVDPNTGSTGPFNSIVVKVTDLCSVQEEYCGQTLSNPTGTDSLAQPMQCVISFFSLFSFVATGCLRMRDCSFQLCSDSGASGAFFPSGSDTLIGSFQEVSCSQWSGSDGSSLTSGACLAGENAANWPSTGCGNQGAEFSPW
jgi:hypothetical protein